MARIAFLDDSFPFTGDTFREKPLGGIQTATVMLAETLAARGHYVVVHGMVLADESSHNVLYRPLSMPWDDAPYDLAVANCVAKLFSYVKAKHRALWMHGPANYMRKPRHFLPYLYFSPTPIFLGSYHASTWRPWLPRFGAVNIPHGVGAPFTEVPLRDVAPAPRALFFSNPRRHLDWVLDVWKEYIHPHMPTASLHIYAGRSNYGTRKDDKLDAALAKAEAYKDCGVEIYEPLPKDKLAKEMENSRVMLYRGDLGETFCFAAAEAQAAGVPLVTAGIGSLAERVEDGKTGFVETECHAFADAALRLLREDDLWLAQHKAAQDTRASLSWENVADQWEAHFQLRSSI
ncbi:MAG: glycosyltransferase [Bdellovibrionales bacterium]